MHVTVPAAQVFRVPAAKNDARSGRGFFSALGHSACRGDCPAQAQATKFTEQESTL